MALWAYFDEGGHPSDSRVLAFSMGGCITTCENWLALDAQWRQTLAEANVTWFHMADFAHFRGEFLGWTEEQRRRLLGRLLDIIDENEVRKVGWARRFEAGSTRPSLEDIYNEAYRTSILYAEHAANGEETHFVFAEHAEVSARVYQHRHDAVRRAYAEASGLGRWHSATRETSLRFRPPIYSLMNCAIMLVSLTVCAIPCIGWPLTAQGSVCGSHAGRGARGARNHVAALTFDYELPLLEGPHEKRREPRSSGGGRGSAVSTRAGGWWGTAGEAASRRVARNAPRGVSQASCVVLR